MIVGSLSLTSDREAFPPITISLASIESKGLAGRPACGESKRQRLHRPMQVTSCYYNCLNYGSQQNGKGLILGTLRRRRTRPSPRENRAYQLPLHRAMTDL